MVEYTAENLLKNGKGMTGKGNLGNILGPELIKYAEAWAAENAAVLEVLRAAIGQLELYRIYYGWPDRDDVIGALKSAIARIEKPE